MAGPKAGMRLHSKLLFLRQLKYQQSMGWPERISVNIASQTLPSILILAVQLVQD